MNTLSKQPYEEINAWVDFSGVVGLTDVLTLVTVTAIDANTGVDSSAAIVKASPAPSVSGQKVLFEVMGGVDGDVHKITVKVSTSAGEKLEEDVTLFVIEQ
jgi:hypothetical protein